MDDRGNSDTAAGSGMLRLGWLFYGNLVLLACAILIATTSRYSPAIDIVFWATVAACVGLRYLDIARMNGRTITNQPATLRHWRRYSLFLFAAAAAVWAVAHGIAYLSR
jgi:uncharacterized membrane protein